MKNWWVIALGIVGAALAASSARAASADYDDGPACAKLLENGDGGLKPADHRRCIIAIATTYIDAEANSVTPDKQLLADDVSRHAVGTPANYVAGSGPKIIADMGHGVIAAIKNRQWTVDGNQAWIAYDGYLKSDLEKPSFYVAERFTIERGRIHEILIAPVAHTDTRRQ